MLAAHDASFAAKLELLPAIEDAEDGHLLSIILDHEGDADAPLEADHMQPRSNFVVHTAALRKYVKSRHVAEDAVYIASRGGGRRPTINQPLIYQLKVGFRLR